MRQANLGRWRSLAVPVATLVVGWTTGATAKSVSPETLCVEVGPSTPSAGPAADAPVMQTARMAEAMLAAEGRGPRVVPERNLDVDVGVAAQPSLAARAMYCSAVGELARRGRFGTPLDAPGFLLDAFLSAERVQATDTAARAAYRLGLALATNPMGTMGRGGLKRGMSDPGPAQADALLDRRDETQACAALDGLTTGRAALVTPATLALRCAARRAEDSGDPDLTALARLRLARLLVDSTEKAPEQATAMRDLAGDVVVAGLGGPGRRPGPELTARLVETGLDSGRSADPAIRAALASLEDDTAAPLDVQAQVAALRGRVWLAEDRRSEAGETIERAIRLESQRATPTRLPDWYMLLARADPDRRRDHVRAAYVALERVRPLLALQDPLTEESTYDLHMRVVFESAVDDALANLPTSAAGSRLSMSRSDQAKLAAAQGIIESYREAELQNAFGNECVNTSAPLKTQDLRANEVILYPIVLPDRVEILVMRGGRRGSYERLPPNLDYDREKVAKLVSRMRSSIILGSSEWKEPSQRLYALLIGPVESLLNDQSTLVIIPDGTLSALPFAALSDSGGRFLVERARLDIAPGLAYAQPGVTRAGRRAFVVAGSLDQDVSLPFGVFGKLENASAEASYATGAGMGGRSRFGLYIQAFDRANLTDALQRNDVDVLHLATHASFNGGTDRTFIVANGDFISLSDLSEMLDSSRAHGHQLDLLILSACETAVGDDKANLGLAGAAVQSGARGVIASLWQVNDESTSLLMKGFYDGYRRGDGKAEAMQASQLAMLRTPRFRAPYYWASLILVGGWR